MCRHLQRVLSKLGLSAGGCHQPISIILKVGTGPGKVGTMHIPIHTYTHTHTDLGRGGMVSGAGNASLMQ